MPKRIKQPGDFLLKNVRLSFPSVFTKAMYEGEETKYMTDCIIPKGSSQEKKLKEEYDNAVKLALDQGALKQSQITPWIKPAGPRTVGIVIDCDADPDKYPPETFGNSWIFKPKSSRKPTVVNRMNEPLTTEDEEIYGGCFANVFCNFFIYAANGGGISSGLQGVQKAADGEAFGAVRKSAADMFGDPSDPDSYD